MKCIVCKNPGHILPSGKCPPCSVWLPTHPVNDLIDEMRAAGFIVEFHGENPVNVVLKSPKPNQIVWCAIGDRHACIRDQYCRFRELTLT